MLDPLSSDVLFIGLGSMGAPLARLLAPPPEHATVLYDLKTEAVNKLIAEIPASQTLKMSATAGSLPGVIVTCLPSSKDVRQALTMFLERLVPGTLWFDCTSGDPIASREFASLLHDKDATFVDVGLSGGPQGAADGSLSAMVGCSEALFGTVSTFFGRVARLVVHCGDTGAGHAVKAVNNMLLGTNLVVASEGLAVLSKYGVNPLHALTAINASSGRSWATINRIPNYVLPQTYDYGFQLSLLRKDMLTALRLASGTGSITPLLSKSFEIVEQASHSLSPVADHTELSKAITQLQSISLLGSGSAHNPSSTYPSIRAMGIKLVVFDCAGTIINEGGLVYKVLQQAMQRAPRDCINYTMEEFNQWHGSNKIEVLRHFGSRAGLSEEEIQTMYEDFLTTLKSAYFSPENEGLVAVVPGTFELFRALRAAGIKVCLNTGYPHSIADRLLEKLGLNDKIDTLVVAEDVGMGRPYPYMIQYLARTHAILDMHQIAKLGDSVRDIQEGRFAGCGFVVGVLTGADSAYDHLKAGADLVMDSVADLRV